MISQRAELPIVALSVKVYQALLLVYPTKFQQEYGSQMAQVFRDCCLRTVRQGGTNGMIKLWAITLFDLVQSVISEHAQKEIEMKKEMKPEDIRMAGGALMWGAVTFVISLLSLIMGDRTGNLTSPFFALSGLLIVFLSPPLLVVGLLGVRNRYGDKVGWFGKNILLLGAVLGSLTTFIGFFGSLGLFKNQDVGWHLIYIGPGILFTGLVLFGFVALYKRPLPRWNVVPVIAGIWYPLSLMLPNIIVPASVTIILLTIQGIALAALGYILKSDVPEETASPA